MSADTRTRVASEHCQCYGRGVRKTRAGVREECGCVQFHCDDCEDVQCAECRDAEERYEPVRDTYGRYVPWGKGPYATLADMRRANSDAGAHFFDADTIRFFRSRIGNVYAGRIFTTSEQFVSPTCEGPRRWTVRVMHDDGYTGDLLEPGVEQYGTGGFQAYETHEQAHAAALRWAARLLEC